MIFLFPSLNYDSKNCALLFFLNCATNELLRKSIEDFLNSAVFDQLFLIRDAKIQSSLCKLLSKFITPHNYQRHLPSMMHLISNTCSDTVKEVIELAIQLCKYDIQNAMDIISNLSKSNFTLIVASEFFEQIGLPFKDFSFLDKCRKMLK